MRSIASGLLTQDCLVQISPVLKLAFNARSRVSAFGGKQVAYWGGATARIGNRIRAT